MKKGGIEPSACRENNFFLQAFLFYTVSVDIHQVSDAEKDCHMPSPAWLGMWQSFSCSGMRL